MSLEVPFLTVAFATPITIALLPQVPDEHAGEMLTVTWRARLGTSLLPYHPTDQEDDADRR